MPIETIEMKPGESYLHRITGRFDITEVLRTLETFWSSRTLAPRVDVLWDVREADFSDADVMKAHSLADGTVRIAPLLRSGRSAVLARNGFEKHAFSYYRALLGGNVTRELEIFNEMKDALAFLHGPD